jgi:hypothetical protein
MSLSAHCKNAAIAEMVRIAGGAWDKVCFVGGDACHSFVHSLLIAQNGPQPLPDLTSAKWWHAVFFYVIRGGTLGVDPDMLDAFKNHYDDNFNNVNARFPGYHDNFTSYMAVQAATNNKVFHSWKILHKHFVTFLRGKYQLRTKKHAHILAGRILADEPRADVSNIQLIQERGLAWLRGVVQHEADVRLRFHLETPQGVLAYRFYMLQELDTAQASYGLTEGAVPVTRFTLMPVHACGATGTAMLDGQTMRTLLPQIKHLHPEFFRDVRAMTPQLQGDLDTYFKRGTRNGGWVLSRTVRSDGVALHILWEKNAPRTSQGRLQKMRRGHYIAKASEWNPPKAAFGMAAVAAAPAAAAAAPENFVAVDPCHHVPAAAAAPDDFVAVDPGHHNIFYGVWFTGEHYEDGTPVKQTRVVTKKEYNKKAGRTKMTKNVEARNKRRERHHRGLLDALAEQTLKTTVAAAFRLAILARAGAYDALYAFNNNRRAKKLKLAMRMRKQRAMEWAIERISWGGEKRIVMGDCSKTTGFRGLTPGGPLKEIKRLMVKKGLDICEENEAYSSKSSVCCHGHANRKMPNRQPPATYKKGKYSEQPNNMPREVHGILICNQCGKTWNRDVVGATNIREIYLARMRGEARPLRFTRAGYDPAPPVAPA